VPPSALESDSPRLQRAGPLNNDYTGRVTVLELLKRLGPSRKSARFVLRYLPPSEEPVTVGELEFKSGTWTFHYVDEYKRRPDLRPIEGFADLERVYQSSVLFPFFAVRIPDLDREDVKRKLKEERVSDPDPTDMLRIFGRSVLSSPSFELLPA
jgi:HipA-like protein